MALTDQQKRVAARRLGREILIKPNKKALFDQKTLIDVMRFFDTAMNTKFEDVPAGWQALTIQQGLLNGLPAAFRDNTIAQEKVIAFKIYLDALVGAS